MCYDVFKVTIQYYIYYSITFATFCFHFWNSQFRSHFLHRENHMAIPNTINLLVLAVIQVDFRENNGIC